MAGQPRIKLDKKEVKKGDIVEVKALVSHVMETGLRKDNDGNLVPRKILNKFVCLVAGKQVFAADFETAVSANPYIQFKFRAEESGQVVLSWTDDDGSTIIGQDSIKVIQPDSACDKPARSADDLQTRISSGRGGNGSDRAGRPDARVRPAAPDPG